MLSALSRGKTLLGNKSDAANRCSFNHEFKLIQVVKKGKDGLAPGCANVATIGSNVTSNDLRFCQALLKGAEVG